MLHSGDCHECSLGSTALIGSGRLSLHDRPHEDVRSTWATVTTDPMTSLRLAPGHPQRPAHREPTTYVNDTYRGDRKTRTSTGFPTNPPAPPGDTFAGALMLTDMNTYIYSGVRQCRRQQAQRHSPHPVCRSVRFSVLGRAASSTLRWGSAQANHADGRTVRPGDA